MTMSGLSGAGEKLVAGNSPPSSEKGCAIEAAMPIEFRYSRITPACGPTFEPARIPTMTPANVFPLIDVARPTTHCAWFNICTIKSDKARISGLPASIHTRTLVPANGISLSRNSCCCRGESVRGALNLSSANWASIARSWACAARTFASAMEARADSASPESREASFVNDAICNSRAWSNISLYGFAQRAAKNSMASATTTIKNALSPIHSQRTNMQRRLGLDYPLGPSGMI
jgi:hypothetical protein